MKKTGTLIALAVTLAFCGMISCYVYAQDLSSSVLPASQITPEVRFVAAGIEDARQKVRCAQATVNYYEFTPKEAFDRWRTLPHVPSDLSTKDLETTQIVQWYVQDSKLAMFVQPDRNDPNSNIVYERLLADTKTARILTEYQPRKRPELGIYHVGSIRRSEDVLKNGLWAYRQEMDPRQHAYYSAVTPMDQVLLKSDPPAVFKGEEMVEGTKCMEVEASPSKGFRATYWFDVEHGFILRKANLFVMASGKSTLIRETKILRLLESNGSWLPAVVEIRDFLQPISDENRKQQEDDAASAILKRLTISNFKIGCQMPPEPFILDWPLGTQVQDQINDKVLQVLELETKELSELNKIRRRENGKSTSENSKLTKEGQATDEAAEKENP